MPEAAVLAIEAGCDGVLICSGDHDAAGGGARGAGPRGRAGAPAVQARRRCAEAPARGEGAVPRRGRRPARGRAAGARAAAGARPRRAPRDRRRDGALRCDCCKAARARARRPPRAGRRPPARSTARSSTAGVAETPRARLRAGRTTSRCSRGSGYVAGPRRPAGARRFTRRWQRSRRSPASSASAAATAARSCCRCSIRRAARARRKPFIGYSDLTSLLTFLTLSAAASSRFTGRCWRAGSARGAAGTTRDSFVRALCRASRWASWRPRVEVHSSRARRAAALLGGTLTQLLASLGTPFAFDAAARATCCFSTTSASGRIGSIAWCTQLRQSGLLARACAASSSASCRGCDEPGGRSDGARRHGATCSPTFPGPVLFGFPSGHTSTARR